MILHDVADGADLVVEPAASLHADLFGHGHLDARDVLAVPHWLEERVREAKVDKVLNWFLSKVMVDPKDRRFRKRPMQRSVQALGGGEVTAKRLFNDDARAVMGVRLGEAFGYGREQLRRDGQVIQRPTRGAKRGSQLPERLGIVIVAVDKLQVRRQRGKGARIDAAMLLQTLVRPRAERIEVRRRLRDADDRDLEVATSDQRLKGRKDLPEREVSRRAKEHERIRLERRHVSHRFSARTCLRASMDGHMFRRPSAMINRLSSPLASGDTS